MPQNITIAAFVFGAVLILIALLSGGFKIFGVEVSGTTGKLGRIVAGAAGTFFLIVGLYGSFDTPPIDLLPSPGEKPSIDDPIRSASAVELGNQIEFKTSPNQRVAIFQFKTSNRKMGKIRVIVRHIEGQSTKVTIYDNNEAIIVEKLSIVTGRSAYLSRACLTHNITFLSDQ
jgi:hypothetical protein